MLEKFTVATFAPHLGTRFQVQQDGLPIALELFEATPYAEQPASGRVPFSVMFRGPNQPVLPQRIYTLAHATLGEFALFLVPIGPDDQGMRYEAVFT